jgi:transposase
MNTKRIMPNGTKHKMNAHWPSVSEGSVPEESNGIFQYVTRATILSWEDSARLDLPNIRVLGIEPGGSKSCFYAETTSPPTHCANCREAATFSKHGSKWQWFLDLPLRRVQVGIHLKRKLYLCSRCKTVRFEPLAMMDDVHRVTKRLLQYIAIASLTQTLSSLSREIGMAEKTIRVIQREFITHLDTQADIPTPVYLGLDELCFKDKHKKQKGTNKQSGRYHPRPRETNDTTPHVMLTDLRRKTVFDLLPDNDYETMVNFFMEVPNREHIKLVCIDFYHNYRLAAHAALPHAEIVIDKFHLLQCVNRSLDEVRKDVNTRLNSAERKGVKYDSRIVRSRHADMTPDKKASLRKWTKIYPELGQAYKVKEAFYAIWDLDDVEEARDRYRTWCANIPMEVKKYFSGMIKTLAQWDQEIFAYFKWKKVLGPERKGITNGFTESMNGVLREMLRAGRGYSFTIARGKILYSRAFNKFQFKHKYRHLRKKGELFRHYDWPPFSHCRIHDKGVPEEEDVCVHGLQTQPPVPRPYLEQVAREYLIDQAMAEKHPPRTKNGSIRIDEDGRQHPIRPIDLRRNRQWHEQDIHSEYSLLKAENTR